MNRRGEQKKRRREEDGNDGWEEGKRRRGKEWKEEGILERMRTEDRRV